MRGHRLAVGTPAARRKRLALPPPDSGAQAVLRRPQLHVDAARRPDVARPGPPGAEHRARRRAPRANQPGIRLRAPAVACGEIPGGGVPRRLSRLSHPEGRHRGVSPPGGLRAPANRHQRQARQRDRGPRLAAGRRDRTRHEHADRGRRGHRQIDAGGSVRRGRRCPRAARRHLCLRRASEHADLAMHRAEASISRLMSKRAP